MEEAVIQVPIMEGIVMGLLHIELITIFLHYTFDVMKVSWETPLA
jgi:hypothetical protein